MCGIGGILRRDGETIPEEWIERIDARIAYRGPDGEGQFRDRVCIEGEDGTRTVEVALVHRRLSIIDHNTGTQPMVSERGRDETEGTLAVVFNGCIYNHRQLRTELESSGHHFTTDHSDTETLLHGYREWGADLTEHLEGMYAFALWDRDQHALVLARDWFGEKPLYIRWGIDGIDSVLAFSSDARSLAELGGRRRPVPPRNPRLWTERYLQLGYNFRGATIYDGTGGGVRNLPPTITERIDDLMPRSPKETHSERDFSDLIERAVSKRLEADVPLGCFLSGGIDSSLIAAFAVANRPDLRTYCVRMPDARYDESEAAAEVAEHLGTHHTTLEVTGDPAEDLQQLVKTLGQPFGDSSLLAAYQVCRAARQYVKVALSGDGGDELFLGYQRHLAARHLYRHRRLLQWIPRRWLRSTHPTSRKHKIARLGAMARDLRLLGIVSMESIFSQHQIYDLLREPAQSPVRIEPGGDPMQALRRFDLVSYLPDDLLMKVDTASMAVALEVRCPFLDRDLVRAALAAPTWQLAPNGRRKGLLRSISRKFLPDHLVDRPKMGFAVPIGEWLSDESTGLHALMRDVLCVNEPFGPIKVDSSAIRRLIEEHVAGTIDHGQRLFALLTLGLWWQSNLTDEQSA
ncbi:MAG: asparagine synthase (glutamine-hydrolyzing) [Phycisphaerales bacterium]|nr:MAG: asparagine synthase (glutamine-hydrolyzing) [Phycisphaerales bacterium]